MNILYTCDDNYVWLMGISMLSLFENNKTADRICVYVSGEYISETNRGKLKGIAHRYGRECTIIDMPELDIPETLCTMRWPKSAFARLYSPSFLPEGVSKILYIDCDTMIRDTLEGLWNVNTNEYPVYGKKDCIGANYRKNIGIDGSGLYINAGVLLLNLTELRKLDIPALIDDFLSGYGRFIHYADQDILNGMFKGRFGVLPPEYNVMTLEFMYSYDQLGILRKPVNYYPRDEIEKAAEHPCIVHFTTCMLNTRPWFKGSPHPLANEFIYYKGISPWEAHELHEASVCISFKCRLLKLLRRFPQKMELAVLGMVHADLYPKAVYLKALFKNLTGSRGGRMDR